MDLKLVGQALQYHGVDLRNNLNIDQEKSVALSPFMHRKQLKDPEIKDEDFNKRVCEFIGKKAELLFKPLSAEEKNKRNDETVDDTYAIMPPLEIFMEVPSHQRRDHFFKSLRSNDCVTGVVSAVLENGLRVQLLCVDKGCSRDIEDLLIQAFCPAKELPKLYPNKSAMEAFQEKDIVRGIVLSVNPETERIIFSLSEKALPDKSIYPKLGLITEEDFCVNYRRKKNIDGMNYEEMLQSILGFNNQGNVRVLVDHLGILENASLLKYHSRLKIPENEYAEGLRKQQSQKLAHHSVAQGVEMYKAGKDLEAMQHFNHALQIDKKNVEALVARGAMFANRENYRPAIQDLEEALSISPKHSNARNYLITVLLTFGKICEDDHQLEEAAMHYSHVLRVDPDNVKAKESLTRCQNLMVLHSSPGKNDKEGKRKNSVDIDSEIKKDKQTETFIFSKTADKLRQLIQEDKKGTSSRHKKRKRRRKRSRSSSSERSRRKRKRVNSSSSSNSSLSSAGVRIHKKKSKNYRRESTDSEDSSKQDRTQQSVSPVKERKKKKSRKEGKKPATVETEGKKNVLDTGLKDRKSADVLDVHKSSSSSRLFLPVSSSELVSGSAACPIFVSPWTSGTDFRGRPAQESISNLTSERRVKRSQKSEKVSKRDGCLMAGREEFYTHSKEESEKIQDRTKRRSSSSSSSDSPSKSSPYSRHASRRCRDVDRSRSGSRTKGPHVNSKGRELAQELLNQLTAGEKQAAWEYISDVLTKKRILLSSDQRSRSRSQRSISCGSRSESPEKPVKRKHHDMFSSQTFYHDQDVGTSQPSKQRQVSAVENKKNTGDGRFLNTNKYPSTQEEKVHGKYEKDSVSGRRHVRDAESSRSRFNSEDDSVKEIRREGPFVKSSFIRSPYLREGSESSEITHVRTPDKIGAQREGNKIQRAEEEAKYPVKPGGFGRFGLDIQEEKCEAKSSDREHMQAEFLNPDSNYKNEEPQQKTKLKSDHSVQIFEQSVEKNTSQNTLTKSETSGNVFVPGILRKAKMDDLSLNRPLISSNELAVIEREIKRRQQNKSEVQNPEEKVLISNLPVLEREFLSKVRKEITSKVPGENIPKIRSSSQEKNQSSGNDSDKYNVDQDRQQSDKFSKEQDLKDADHDALAGGKPHGSPLEIYKELLKHVKGQKELSKILQERLEVQNINVKECELDVADNIKGKLKTMEIERKADNSSTVGQCSLHESSARSAKPRDLVSSGRAHGGTENSSDKIITVSDGWSVDVHGNKYFATKGSVASDGWHRDEYGDLSNDGDCAVQEQASEEPDDRSKGVVADPKRGSERRRDYAGSASEHRGRHSRSRSVNSHRERSHSRSRSRHRRTGRSRSRSLSRHKRSSRSHSRSLSRHKRSSRSRSGSLSRHKKSSRSHSRSLSRHKRSSRSHSWSRSRHMIINRSRSQSRHSKFSRSHSRSLSRHRRSNKSRSWSRGRDRRSYSRGKRSNSRDGQRKHRNHNSKASSIWHREKSPQRTSFSKLKISRSKRIHSRSQSGDRSSRSHSGGRRSESSGGQEVVRRGHRSSKYSSYRHETSSRSRTLRSQRSRSCSRDRRSRSLNSRERLNDSNQPCSRPTAGTPAASGTIGSSVPHLTSNLKSQPLMVSSKWDTFDAVNEDSSKHLEGKTKNENSEEVKQTALLQGLPYMEKFLTDLKQKQRKQWIAEGKLKETNTGLHKK